MAEKPFIRVKDKRTRHMYDVHEQAFDPEIHEELKRFPRSATARDAKPAVLRAAKPRARREKPAATPPSGDDA
ncbi:hypothetical protein ACF1AJ_20445 [Leifsonia sp. NPDC014704]|uniref:hypothetical protein n=1 Tax=Leifsonia sp. NPDC014704 TaxID=3364123 RepID=UPI0036F4856D